MNQSGHEAVEIGEAKHCDFHPHLTAVVDGKTIFGPWANMCDECFEHVGVGLGLGRGQRLIVVQKNDSRD